MISHRDSSARWVSASLAFALVVSCGGPTEPPPPPTLTSLSISPKPGTVEAESSIQFSVSAIWSDGSTRVPAVAWSATGGTIDNVGRYTAGTASGTFQVTASASGKSDISTVSITPRPVKATLCIGEGSPCVKAKTIWLGEGVMLNGSCSGAFSAEKSWPPAGVAPVSVKETNTPTTVGLHTFTYNCMGEGGTDIATVTVVVESIPPIEERATRDRPDEVLNNQVKFVYMLSTDGQDLGHDTNGQMEIVIRSAQIFLAEQTGKIPAVDTYGGRPDILFVRSPKTHAELLGNQPGLGIITPLLDELNRAIGGLDPKKKYIIFYQPLSSLGVAGSAVQGGAGGGVYPSHMEWGDALVDPNGVMSPFVVYGHIWLHEFFHTLGVVDPKAPNSYGGHVMDDPSDLMCGFPQPEPAQGCYSGPRIDQNKDDYWFEDNASSIFNASTSPWITPAPSEMVVAGVAMMRAQALALPTVRYEFREELIFPPKRP